MEYSGDIQQKLLKMCLDNLIQGGYVFTMESDKSGTTIRLNAGAVITFDNPTEFDKSKDS